MPGTSEAYLLDTHIWVWLMAEDRKLSAQAFKRLDGAQRRRRLHGSVISAWEIGLLESRGRLSLKSSLEDWFAASFEDDGIQLFPLTVAAGIEAHRLPGELHRDPVDRLLVATCRVHGFTLLTRDEQLLRYAAQGHFPAERI